MPRTSDPPPDFDSGIPDWGSGNSEDTTRDERSLWQRVKDFYTREPSVGVGLLSEHTSARDNEDRDE